MRAEFHSYTINAWAAKQHTGSPATKCVLLVLATHANKFAESYPSQETIAKEADCSVRSVRRHLCKLRDDGVIEIQPRRLRGRRSTDLYRLCIPESEAARFVDDDDNGGVQPANSAGRNPDQPAKNGDLPANERGFNRPTVAGTDEHTSEHTSVEHSHTDARPRFEDGWKAFEHPKAGDPKEKAREAWTEAVANGAVPDKLVAACESQGAYVRSTPSELPCQMHRWLRERRYEGISSYQKPSQAPGAAIEHRTIDAGHAKAWGAFRQDVVKLYSEAWARSWLGGCSFDGHFIQAPSAFVAKRLRNDVGDLIDARGWKMRASPKRDREPPRS